MMQLLGNKEIGQILNMSNEIVKLGVTGSAEKAEELKHLYTEGWRIDPKNIFQHPNVSKKLHYGLSNW